MSPHDDIRIAIAVDVARSRYAMAQKGVRLVGFVHRGGGGVDAGDRAMVDKERAFVVLTVVVPLGPHDDIRIAVTVDIAGTRYAEAQNRACQVGLHHRVGNGVDADSRTVVDKERAFVVLAVVVPISPYDDICIAVAVDVARSRYAPAHPSVCLVGLDHRVGNGVDAGSCAVVDKERAFVVLTVIVKISPHDDIRITVTVDVARSRYADAQIRAGLIGVNHRICRGSQQRIDG